MAGRLIRALPAAESLSASHSDHPLSHGQRALWFMQRIAPESAAHNVVYPARIPGPLDTAAFRRSLQRLVDRHPVLRATILLSRGEPVQRVHERMEVALHEVDAARWTAAELDERLIAEMRRPFDLERGPLMRMTLFRRSAEEHVALLSQHHAITDMWSLAIFMAEMGAFYTAEMRGEPAALKPLGAHYADFTEREAARLAGAEGERQWEYWRRQLGGELPLLQLPTDRPRPTVGTDLCGTHVFRLDAPLVQGLKRLSKEQNTALFTTVLAAFQVLLHRYTGQEDILVGSTRAGRSRDMARLLGYFVNSVVLRGDLSGDPRFVTFLHRMERVVQEASDNDAYPFPLLVERLQPTRDLSRSPIFQVLFAWQKTTRLVKRECMTAMAMGEQGSRVDLGQLPLESFHLPHQVSPFDLTLLMAEAEEDLAATLIYNADLFDRETIHGMVGHLQTLLEAVVADPDQPVSGLPLLTRAEQRRILVEWNETDAAIPDARVPQLIARQAQRRPDALALSCEGASLSYADLDRRANRLAHVLLQRGVGTDTLVAVGLLPSPDLVVALLAIWKVGAAYLPLDPAYPQERLAFMLEDSGVPLLITRSDLRERFGPVPELLCLDTEAPAIERESSEAPEAAVSLDHLAYCIYTSGSTGQPKGALLEHRGLANLAAVLVETFAVTEESRVLQFASASFDASISEIVMALVAGGTLVLSGRERLMAPETLLSLLREERITTVTLPPSLLAVLPCDDLPELETVASAGEACSWEIALRWGAKRRFLNGYGPTETTVAASYYRVGTRVEGTATVPIGRPNANTRAYVLDRQGQPAPIGVPGELYIGGACVGRGYLNRPELTAERFVLCHVARAACRVENGVPNAARETRDAQRLYRTGDRVRWLPDGNLEFIGRVDEQLKVRGFRIEPGEIEGALTQHPGVRESVVVAREEVAGDRRLVAYLVTHAEARSHDPESMGENGNSDPMAYSLSMVSEVRRFLKERLPEHMIPSTFVPLDALPLTPNGKVDRRALPDPRKVRRNHTVGRATPRNEIEQRIAAIWCETLGVEQVGTQDNFFELGGHSLLAVKVHGMLQETFQRQLSMVELFRYPTVAQLGEYLTRVENGGRHEPGEGSRATDRMNGHGNGEAHAARAGRQKEAVERRQQLARAARRRIAFRSENGLAGEE